MAATTLASAIHHTGMAELAREAKMPLMLMALRENTAADADAQADDDEVLHAVGTAEGIFA